jgi:hypothetical protein
MIGGMYPVTLTGRTVVLREFRADDAAEAFLIFRDDAARARSTGSAGKRRPRSAPAP